MIGRLVAEYDYQLKFVIDQPGDVEEVELYLAEFPTVAAERVWLMPQGRTAEEVAQRARWVERACLERGWNYCPRMQLAWFGAARRT